MENNSIQVNISKNEVVNIVHYLAQGN